MEIRESDHRWCACVNRAVVFSFGSTSMRNLVLVLVFISVVIFLSVRTEWAETTTPSFYYWGWPANQRISKETHGDSLLMIKLELKQLREKTTDFFGVYSLTFVLFIVSLY